MKTGSLDTGLEEKGLEWHDESPGKMQRLKDGCKSMCSWCVSDWTSSYEKRCAPALTSLCGSTAVGFVAGLGFYGLGTFGRGATTDPAIFWIFGAIGAAIGCCCGLVCAFAICVSRD